MTPAQVEKAARELRIREREARRQAHVDSSQRMTRSPARGSEGRKGGLVRSK